MKDRNKVKKQHILRRQIRTRAKIKGTDVKPRVSVFRSLNHISVQAIDDVKKVTLVAASDKETKTKGTKTEVAVVVGELMGKKLNEKKINYIVFDKGAYKYHGRVKALAEGIRKAGINF
ncbi:50S ribosomal protein L18 [Candidatus Parcubacteria bacterium]|nr:MAG: 50S ribosomal protein L18 [Candidatus Parcubacteria bacterium]